MEAVKYEEPKERFCHESMCLRSDEYRLKLSFYSVFLCKECAGRLQLPGNKSI